MKLLIKNGTLVDPVGGIGGVMDLLVEDGRIVVIGNGLDEPDAQVLDAAGLTVSAGLIDMHVHLRDPGLTEKEDILTGSLAAAHGGVTSIACMPNTKPVIDTPEQVAYVQERAAQNCGVNVWPIGALSLGQQGREMADLRALREAGVVAISDDGNPVMDANLMRDGLMRANRYKLTILSHCEDDNLVRGRAVNEGRVSRQLGLPGRPAIAEDLMVMRDAMLAEETRTPVHICHVSTAGAVGIIRQYKRKGVQITCETCPQYFTLTHEEVLRQGSLAKVNPPLRATKDKEAILNGLRDGTIDCIVTDHAPHTAAEKARPLTEAPSGMVGLETSLALALTGLYHTGLMSLSDIIQKMTINPAKILRIPRGSLSLGAAADITIFDPDERWTVDPERFASKGRNTPFGGMELRGKVKYTIVNGRIIYQDC
ncbi:MAG TPA: dihydroorotase [Candidatus Onthomonas avicola]|nr:dihydroorotase [Candidatus Onthomonas avicola]